MIPLADFCLKELRLTLRPLKSTWLGLLSMILLACASPGCMATPRPGQRGEQICLSVRVLAEQAGEAQASERTLPAEVRTCAGIGSLEGFVVDEENDDIILIGRRSPGWPSLHLDDVAAVIRAVWTAHADPYCSLDPRSEDVLAIQNLLSDSGGERTPEQVRETFAKLQSLSKPQMVVVVGVPRNSRHAHVMIDADYHMKQVSQGLAQVKGVTSCLDRMLKEARTAVWSRMPPSGLSMSRFWFRIKKGYPTYIENEGTVLLDKCPVVVLTERQMATADGRLQDGGGEDPNAQAFAEEFSRCFEAATLHVPVYAELENLYRLHALVRAMRLRGAAEKAGLSLAFYLKDYRWQEESPMPEFLPGLANGKEWRTSLVRGGMVYDCLLFPMVCGGVSMEIPLVPSQFRSAAPGSGLEIRSTVLHARPRRDALVWTLR